MRELLNKLGNRCAKFFSEPLHLKGEREQIKQYFCQDPFSHQLPYEAFDENGIFLNTQSAGFVIEATPLVGGDDAIVKTLHSFFQDFALEGASIQCLLWADHRINPFLKWWSNSTSQRDIFDELTNQRTSYFEGHPHLSPRIFRFILSYSLPLSNDPIQETMRKLGDVKDKMLKVIRSMTKAFPWNPQDLIETVGGLVNFSQKTDLVKRTYNPYQSIASQITTGGKIQVEEDQLIIKKGLDETCYKSFRVIDTPSHWSQVSMQNLIGDVTRDSFRIPYPFFIHYGVYYPPQGKAESNFNKRSQLIENQGKSNYLIRLIPELAGELRECDYIRRATTKGVKFVWTQLSCGIWASPNALNNAEQSVRNLFNANEFKLAENTRVHLPHLISTLPMVWSEYIDDLKNLSVLKTTVSPECASFVPFQGEWRGTSTPGMLLLGRRGQLLNWNPFDSRANYNCIVAGTSGAGKSVFMQDLLLGLLRSGSRVYVMDVGRSFEKLNSILQGQQIEFSKESNICLNPFSKIRIHDQEDKETAFSFLKSIIACMAAPTDGTTDHENCLIEEAIHDVWEEKKHAATMTDISLKLLSRSDDKAKILGTMLTPYTRKGMYAKYFEGENNINFTNQMILIELEELKGKKDLQAVVLQLFIMTIANEAFLGDRKTPFVICIDEAWDLLRSPQTEEFIETLARRLRKYRGSLIVGTQNIDDFYSKPGARAAFDNSDWMCLLKQKVGTYSKLAAGGKVHQDEQMIRALDSISNSSNEYKEVMICDADGNYSIARLVLDPFSRLLYSTTAHEYTRLKDLTNMGLTMTQAINKMLKEPKHG